MQQDVQGLEREFGDHRRAGLLVGGVHEACCGAGAALDQEMEPEGRQLLGRLRCGRDAAFSGSRLSSDTDLHGPLLSVGIRVGTCLTVWREAGGPGAAAECRDSRSSSAPTPCGGAARTAARSASSNTWWLCVYLKQFVFARSTLAAVRAARPHGVGAEEVGRCRCRHPAGRWPPLLAKPSGMCLL